MSLFQRNKICHSNAVRWNNIRSLEGNHHLDGKVPGHFLSDDFGLDDSGLNLCADTAFFIFHYLPCQWIGKKNRHIISIRDISDGLGFELSDSLKIADIPVPCKNRSRLDCTKTGQRIVVVLFDDVVPVHLQKPDGKIRSYLLYFQWMPFYSSSFLQISYLGYQEENGSMQKTARPFLFRM